MPPSWAIVFRMLYSFLTSLARLAVRTGRSKDLEIIVLRHENTVLRRQNNRPVLNDDDRTLLGAIATALPADNGKAGSSHPKLCSAGTANASPGTGPSLLFARRADHPPRSSCAN